VAAQLLAVVGAHATRKLAVGGFGQLSEILLLKAHIPWLNLVGEAGVQALDAHDRRFERQFGHGKRQMRQWNGPFID